MLPRQLYASDLHAGEQVAARQVTLNARAFADFAALSGDRHPIHYDRNYIAEKGMKAPIAHGLLVVAITALGATDFSDALHESMIAMTSVSAEFLAPAWEGDVVDVRLTVEDIVPKSNGKALVSMMVTVTRQDGEQLARVRQQYLLKAEKRI
jgi:acyl dehydratase